MEGLLILLVFSPILADNGRKGRGAFTSHDFKSFKGPSFFSSSPSSGSSYSPGPSSYPAPSYHQPTNTYGQPSHNCSVEDEKVTAEVCLPSFTQECSQIQLKGTQITNTEKCLPITRTVCTESTVQQEMTICRTVYEPKEETAEATSVDVTFSQECSQQMVTVCTPQAPGYGGYKHGGGSYQRCREVAQETCYNVPSVSPDNVQVSLTVPSPAQDCSPVSVSLPTVECQDVTEEKCVSLPQLEEAEVAATECRAVLGPPDCKSVELVLPKQVCQELLYGYASKPTKPAPAYPRRPEPAYSSQKPAAYAKQRKA